MSSSENKPSSFSSQWESWGKGTKGLFLAASTASGLIVVWAIYYLAAVANGGIVPVSIG